MKRQAKKLLDQVRGGAPWGRERPGLGAVAVPGRQSTIGVGLEDCRRTPQAFSGSVIGGRVAVREEGGPWKR